MNFVIRWILPVVVALELAAMLTFCMLMERDKKRLVDEIKSRGHFEVDTFTGECKWIPGRWKTPTGPE